MTAQLLKDDDRKRSGGVVGSSSVVANEERQFVAAAKNGDSVAFGILCTRTAGMVFNIARRLMPTNEDAEDIVQESFKLAFIHLKNFRGDSRFSTWLTRIVTNAALMRLRNNKVRREPPVDQPSESQRHLSPFDVEDQSLNPEQLYAQKERHRMLRRAVNQLTPGMRRAIELRELDERSTEETARMVGISVNSVKAQVFYGRKKLRQLLNRMNSIPMYRKEPLRFGCKPNSALGQRVAHSAGD
jgi:RNA polymerase sigma-70 factor, ECF subfamily